MNRKITVGIVLVLISGVAMFFAVTNIDSAKTYDVIIPGTIWLILFLTGTYLIQKGRKEIRGG
jgi:hypothetical protein